MVDSLTRICCLAEVSSEDRRRLLDELEVAARVFARIEAGAQSGGDRNFAQASDTATADETDRLFARLREWPILRRLLPRIRHLRHESSPTIELSATPGDDAVAARSLLTNTLWFSGSYGEQWGATHVRVDLTADAIQVHEETFATALNGRPFDESDYSADYSLERTNSLWQKLRERLDAETFRETSAMAERMGCAVFPCDRCGRASQILELPQSTLHYDSPFTAPGTAEVLPDKMLALRTAMAAQDMPAIRELNREWTEGYCAKCDASYCKKHIEWGQEGPEYLWVKPYARCPLGHCWDL